MKNWSAALHVLIVGFYVPLSLLIPTGIGLLLDRRANNEFPLFALVGLGLGTVIMVYGVYRMVRPFLRQVETQGEEENARLPLARLADLLTSRRRKDREEG
jgi:hypothetical protein